MLPGSVEARAKMKITLGQREELPVSRSLRVDESWRASTTAASFSISTGAAGRAATRPAAARSDRNFILAVWLFEVGEDCFGRRVLLAELESRLGLEA